MSDKYEDQLCIVCGECRLDHVPLLHSGHLFIPVVIEDDPTPIVTNSAGGMQSQLDYRFDLLDAQAMQRLAGILDYGAKRYSPDNWRLVDQKDHINHAIAHIFEHMRGNTEEDHLGHAFCRLMFAIGVEDAKAD